MIKVVFIIFFLICALNVSAQKINWISFEELPVKMREEKRPIMIFIHTDWCKYCKMQESITYSNDTLVNKLNDDYYCIRFNAETTDSIIFLGKPYYFIKTGANTGEHELATFLATQNGKVVYPTTVFFDDKFQFVTSLFGYQSVKSLKLF